LQDTRRFFAIESRRCGKSQAKKGAGQSAALHWAYRFKAILVTPLRIFPRLPHNNRHRPPKNPEIIGQGKILRVLNVQLDHPSKTGAVFSAQLPQAGQPRRGIESAKILRA
jgi:hypothetical protein